MNVQPTRLQAQELSVIDLTVNESQQAGKDSTQKQRDEVYFALFLQALEQQNASSTQVIDLTKFQEANGVESTILSPTELIALRAEMSAHKLINAAQNRRRRVYTTGMGIAVLCALGVMASSFRVNVDKNLPSGQQRLIDTQIDGDALVLVNRTVQNEPLEWSIPTATS